MLAMIAEFSYGLINGTPLINICLTTLVTVWCIINSGFPIEAKLSTIIRDGA
jgi:hypothetical protein